MGIWKNDIEPEFIEDSKRSYGHRTWANAEWSDITLAFAVDFSSPGEVTTKKAAGDKYVSYALSFEDIYGREFETLEEHRLSAQERRRRMEESVRRVAGAIRSNPHYSEEGIRLNVAGNSMITLSKFKLYEWDVFDVVASVIRGLLEEGIKIKEIRSGGQTGIDEFGIVAAQYLGVKCSILAPKGFRMHYKEGEEIEGMERFVGRFLSDAKMYKSRFDQIPVRHLDSLKGIIPVYD